MEKNLIEEILNPNIKNIDIYNYYGYIDKNIPELLKLKSINLSASNNLFMNTNQILKRINDIKDISTGEKLKLQLAAFLHKVGLPDYLKQNPKDKEFLNNHCKLSSLIARQIMQRLVIPYKFYSEACLLIERNYLPKNFKSLYARINSFKKLALEINLKSLYHLALSDIRFTSFENKDYLENNIENFRNYCTQMKIFGREPNCYLSKNRISELMKTDNDKIIRKLQNETIYFQLKSVIKNEKQAVEWIKKTPSENYSTIYITIGIAGCGKTTWINKNLTEVDVVSMDKMRKRLLDDKLDQSENRYVFLYSYKSLLNFIGSKKDVIWDATSCTRKSRDKIIRISRNLGAYIILVFFDIPLDEIKKRNKSRKETVDDRVIERQFNLLEFPRKYEADEIWIIDKENNKEKFTIEYNQ